MSSSRFTMLALGLLVATQTIHAVPVDSGGASTIGDRKSFIPYRKHMPLPGKVIGVMVFDAQPVLGLEGRSGPADQICLGHGLASYRWLYVPVEKDPMIPWLNLPVGPTGAERKRFDKLSLASPTVMKPLGIESKYALVEIEVNGGLGSPADDSCVATKNKVLDGNAEFPLKVEQVIADLRKRYNEYHSEQGREINVMMEKAAAAAIKDKKSSGQRERNDVMYVTWLPESQRLRVHFRTISSDGLYQYGGGAPEFGGPPRSMAKAIGPGAGPANVKREPGAKEAGAARYGTQFGVEFGVAYEVSKEGKLERTLTLPMETFQREIKAPAGMMRTGGFAGTARAMATMMALPPRPVPAPGPPKN